LTLFIKHGRLYFSFEPFFTDKLSASFVPERLKFILKVSIRYQQLNVLEIYREEEVE
jgi:hypothetical protein